MGIKMGDCNKETKKAGKSEAFSRFSFIALIKIL